MAGDRPETSSGNSLKLGEFLPYRLNVVTQAVSQGLERLYSSEFGISVPEWRIIAALGELGAENDAAWAGMTARDLAQHGRMGKVMVSRAITTLAQRRIVARRANRSDRREAFVRLTAKGEAVYKAIVPRARAFQTSLEEGIAAQDLAAFDRVIAHFLAQAERADALLLAPQHQTSDSTSNTSQSKEFAA